MTENERYCVRAGYWHNYTGIGRCEDENLTTNEVCDLINEQHETIQRLEAQLSHLEYRFTEYRNKQKSITKEEVKETLQKHYDKYVDGIDCKTAIYILADELGVDLE
jgi:uncharacterized coiled-coil protein SlyX